MNVSHQTHTHDIDSLGRGAYRSRGEGDDQDLAAREKLEQLARRGAQARAAAQERARRDKARKAARRKAREALLGTIKRPFKTIKRGGGNLKRSFKRRFGNLKRSFKRLCSVSAVGPFVALFGTRTFWVLAPAALLLALFFSPVMWTVLSVIAVGLLSIGYLLVRQKRVKHWFDNLPCDCSPLWSLLSEPTVRRLELRVHFVEDAPARNMVENLLLATKLGGIVKKADGKTLTFSLINNRFQLGTYIFLRWFRKFVGRVALPLHAVYPITEISVRSHRKA